MTMLNESLTNYIQSSLKLRDENSKTYFHEICLAEIHPLFTPTSSHEISDYKRGAL